MFGDHGGGGGAALGRIRVNTRTGNATVDVAAVMSPAFGEPGATQGPVTTQ
jgi:hypothetical protein